MRRVSSSSCILSTRNDSIEHTSRNNNNHNNKYHYLCKTTTTSKTAMQKRKEGMRKKSKTYRREQLFIYFSIVVRWCHVGKGFWWWSISLQALRSGGWISCLACTFLQKTVMTTQKTHYQLVSHREGYRRLEPSAWLGSILALTQRLASGLLWDAVRWRMCLSVCVCVQGSVCLRV